MRFKPSMLNQELVERQDVSIESQNRLCELYETLDDIIGQANEQEDMIEVKKLLEQIEDIEFELQELWNFKKDSNYHKYWMYIDHCKCPTIDNLERLGYGRIINHNCPIHGMN